MKNIYKKAINFVMRIPVLFAVTFNISDFKSLAGTNNLLPGGDPTSLGDYIQSLFDLAIIFGGIIAVLRITYGGFLYMTSDIAQTKSQAKSIIMNSIAGLLLLLAIVIILRQINPDILKLDIGRNLQEVKTQ